MAVRQQLSFEKYQGLGNDFVILDMRTEENQAIRPLNNVDYKLLSDRRLGIGCDQVMVILPPANDPSDEINAEVKIFNSDGSEAEACGNGTRAVVHYLLRNGAPRVAVKLATPTGVLSGTYHGHNDVEVEQGFPRFLNDGRPLDLASYGLGAKGFAVTMGNPHLIVFLETDEKVEVERVGSRLEHHPFFPRRTNVEFCEVDPEANVVKVTMWERGAGRTLACGSGASAAAFAAISTGKLAPTPAECGGRTVEGILEGGRLILSLDSEGRIRHRGAATPVFKGSYDVSL